MTAGKPKPVSTARWLAGYVGLQLYFLGCVAGASETGSRQIVATRLAATDHLKSIGSLADDTRLNLAVGLPLRNKGALSNLIQEIYNPASPLFHHYLKPSEFAEQFGPAAKDYQTLIDFARSNHFQVTRVHPNRTLLDVSASVADIRRVLGVNIRVYQHPTEARTFYAPDGDASLNAGVPVAAIEGLDNFHGAKPLGGTGPGGGYIAQDLRTAYVPGVALTGAGQTAALVEFDGYYPSDITAYANKAGLSAVTLSNVLIDGFSGSPGNNNEEVAADAELLMAMAPGLSKIVLYEESQFAPVDDLLNQIATDDLAAQISCSWFFFMVNTVVQDQIFQQYAAQGQSFLCASGDFGAQNPDQFPVPLGDPYITLVGGTQLMMTSNANAWQAETVWNDSSGGFTTNYPIPPWQAGVNMSANQGSSIFRNVPDVAACAANIFVVANNGKYASFSGTSAAAPLWAAFTALVNQQAAQYGNGPVGFLNPALYAIGASPGYAANFHDIVSGNNTNSVSPNAFFAVPGYDLCTGWGTPNGSALINSLAPPDTLVMLPVPGFTILGTAGGPFNAAGQTYLLTNGSAASLNWGLQCSASWLSVSPTAGTLQPGQTCSVTVDLNAAASSLPVGNYTAQLAVTNLSNGLLHQRSFNLQISDPLSLSPAGGFEFAGPPSGPFNMSAATCELTNASQSAVNWSLVSAPVWLDVSPSSGVLPPAGTVALSCSLNAAATNLPAGAYSNALVLSNNTFASAENLPLLLLDGQLVQNGGFETGSLADWTLSGSPTMNVVTTETNAVHSGDYGVYLGESGDLGYLSQWIPTVAGSPYVVSLWLNTVYALSTNEFSVSWEGGTLFDSTDLPAMGWTNLQFTVWATNAISKLQIGFRDDGGGFGLDDVSVTAAPPILSSVTPAFGPLAGGAIVTLAGAGFQSHVAVAFGGVPAGPVTDFSATNLTVVAPAGVASGPVSITLTNADGQTTVLTNGFLYLNKLLVAWDPPPIPYGTALDGAQLDASANVPGLFTYIPPAGTVLDAGTNVLEAVFDPLDIKDYFSVTNYVTLIVLPVPLSVTASNATRPYGVDNPVFTGSLNGLQNGDNITASYGCSATFASPTGTYPIVPVLADPNGRLSNYLVSVVNGTLTVQAPAPAILQITPPVSNTFLVTWSAVLGGAYQVQTSSSLASGSWSNVGGMIVATNTTASLAGLVTSSNYFYRVVQVPQ